MKDLKHITESAKALGACRLLREGMSYRDLSGLLFSPQGREFCAEKDFPGRADLKGISEECLERHGIYSGVTGSRIKVSKDACFIKSYCSAEIEDSSVLHRIVALDNSEIKLLVEDYAVLDLNVSESSKAEVYKTKNSQIYPHGKGDVVIIDIDL